MTNDKAIRKEITNEGIRLSHPSGVIQILTPKRLNFLIEQFEKAKVQTEKQLTDIKKDLQNVEAAVSQSP